MAVIYQKEFNIVIITLNRPETLNRIDADIFRALCNALSGFRMIVLTMGVGILCLTGL
jgi:enoyl-CoA hydratase/carnithine racemase